MLQCGQEGHWALAFTAGPKCYAFNQFGHFAKECPDVAAKARNDEYLKTRKSSGESEET
ncbi:hypothetical protein PI125_g21142 [Phytophthora idaei]|nr:hypothetical protein PI125_g21142 [Phytophthora idaei]